MNIIYNNRMYDFYDFYNNHRFDSPLEKDFFINVLKHIKNDVFIFYQFGVGNYRLDYLIYDGDNKIAVELDGKDYHDKNRDSIRDKNILEETDIDYIIRFAGKSAFYNYNLCASIIEDHSGGFFNSKFLANNKNILEKTVKTENDTLYVLDGEYWYEFDCTIMENEGREYFENVVEKLKDKFVMLDRYNACGV